MIRLYLRKGVKADYSLAIAMEAGLEATAERLQLFGSGVCLNTDCDKCRQHANCKKVFDALMYCRSYIESEEHRMREKEELI